MSMEGMRILLDTNVWLDNFMPGNSGFETAHRLLNALLDSNVVMLYPACIMGDVFFQLRREAKQWYRINGRQVTETVALAARDHAWDCVKSMHSVATAVGVDEHDVAVAIAYRSLHEDLEDDFILAAALRARADYLVTSDKTLLHKSPVAALSPPDMLALLQVGVR